jgi:hypothetical protein
MELFKAPGIAETLDWSEALLALGAKELNFDAVESTLGVVLKYQDDISRVRAELTPAVDAARAAGE